MTARTVWTCPRCGHRVEAIARDVWHACPANRDNPTRYRQEPKP